jgi:hypothetical protein
MVVTRVLRTAACRLTGDIVFTDQLMQIKFDVSTVWDFDIC